MVSEEFIKKLKEQGWPQEFNEKLKIGNLESNVGIATLWTFQDVVYNGLDESKYAVVGNYYDKKNALEPFIRNCLANPNIRYVILIGNDKAGSREVLVNFFEKGFLEGKVVDTDTPLPRGIPEEDIEKVRSNVTLIDVVSKVTDQNSSEEYARVVNEVISGLEEKEPYGEPKLYEKPKIETDSFPSEKVGFVLRGKTVGDVWLKILNEVYNYGTITKMKTTDSTEVRECINLMAVIDEEDPDNPKMEDYFRFDEKYLKEYYDEICSAKVPEGTLYTYGSRFRAWKGKDEGNGEIEAIDQIQDIIEYLKKDTFRKSALAISWITEDELTRRYLNKDKNSPCIVLVQPNVQDGVLHLTVYIRSNDMFRAWPLNAFGLRKLQKILSDGLGVDMGKLTTVSCSAHLYQDTWEETKELLEKYFKDTNCFFDPRGYYAISLKQGEIVVEHYSPDSQILKEYNGKSAREINDAINSSQHPNDAYHSSYLGEELMKAEIALSSGLEYTQDMPLNLSSSGDSCSVDGSCEVSSEDSKTC